jgi:hypothetical protein
MATVELCPKIRDTRWGEKRDQRLEISSWGIHGPAKKRVRPERWPQDVKSRYETQRRMCAVFAHLHKSSSGATALERVFREQVNRWKDETGHLSSVMKMRAHPSYLRIVGLAKHSTDNELERLLLRELQNDPDHWFDALTALTGEDPVQPQHDFDEAVAAWLTWGRAKGII